MRWSLLIGSLLIGVVCSQNVDPDLKRLCNARIRCGDCILASPQCIWCADQNFNGTRCYVIGDTQADSLCLGMKQNPEGGVRSMEMVNFNDFTQVSPANVNLTVRPGAPITFNLNVRPARNFPIDLYLLMDLSFSMNDDLANLQRLGTALAASIVGLSSNFSIGFGSFVDKVTGPFTTLDTRFQIDPCRNNENIVCNPTYSYRHVISLTNDSTRFSNLVLDQRISGNQDFPEGGFDGFLQSVLCTKLIGWRSLSRKLLLYITDAGFHIAGDGKLAGVVLPHPSMCMLPEVFPNNAQFVEYQESLIYDYPSIGQIAQALRDQDIIPIFAAEQRVREFYDALATELGEGAFVGTLESDSRNVVELVETLYDTISQRVIFDQEPVPGVSVLATPTTCPGFIVDGICNGLEIERDATFQVSVSITECTPQLASGEVIVPLRVVGFGTVEIQLTALCQCPCEDEVVPNSPDCSSNGNLTCGQCLCNPGNFGETCQCDAGTTTVIICPMGENGIQCTGRGTCQCGICDCQDGFFGPACECDERDCINQDSGLLCSGRGICGCNGQCTCNIEPISQQPYFGQDLSLNLCECTPNTQNCRDPNNRTSICNGVGSCGCEGACECEDSYSGLFCEVCSGSDICAPTNCGPNRECANCVLDIIVMMVTDLTPDEYFDISNVANLPSGTILVNSSDSASGVDELQLPPGQCTTQCGNGAVIIRGVSTAQYAIDGEMAVRCEEFRDGCTYRYFVGVEESTNNFTAVHVEYERSCPEASASTAPWIIAIALIIPLLILGLLLLLLLKVLLLLWDYVEVRKFENDIKNTKYSKNENPLYRSAAKDYKNPLYGQ